MPEVSVIIPVYNRPDLLREAAGSVFTQSFTDFELIIVDDGSTDSTPDIAEKLAVTVGAEGRCRVIHITHTGFPGAARNRGAGAAKGRYLAFLDSDDTWLPGKLERQHFLMTQNATYNDTCRISHTREIWRRGTREVSQKGQKHSREGDIFTDALKKCIIGPSTVMMERALFFETGGFHERLEIAEDYEYWLRITSRNMVGYLNEAHTVKRAGEWPQLSEKYGMIEWFRISALAGLLGIDMSAPDRNRPEIIGESPWLPGYLWEGFASGKRAEAAEEFVRKCRIWAAGCRKRGRISEARRINDIIQSVGG